MEYTSSASSIFQGYFGPHGMPSVLLCYIMAGRLIALEENYVKILL